MGILDELIEAHDRNRKREPAKTPPHGQQPTMSTAKTVEERRREFHEKKNLGQIPSSRGKNQRLRDVARHELRLEKQRLFNEAFYDNTHSLGEVDAMTGSEILNVDRGDVLRDPKVRGYKHPAMDWWRVSSAEIRARVAAGKSKGEVTAPTDQVH